jgi:hypothetical protein
MKKTFIAAVVALVAGTGTVDTANAGQSCSKDFFGNINCVGTGQDRGYRSTIGKRDFFGNTRIQDNRGNSQTCSKDFFGNINCR